MHFCWSTVIAAIGAVAISALSADQSQGAARDKVIWHKSANYTALQPLGNKQRLGSISSKKLTPRFAVKSYSSDKSRNPQPVKILASFVYGDEALLVGPVDQSIAVSRPAPLRCEWARSIVRGYAFENVESKSCDGSIYDFIGTRAGRMFSIKVSAINGELTQVDKIDPNVETSAGAETLMIVPAGQ